MPGYKLSYRDRYEKGGGCVNEKWHNKSWRFFRISVDWSKGEDKVTKTEVVCEPGYENAKKFKWIEKMDAVLSSVRVHGTAL